VLLLHSEGQGEAKRAKGKKALLLASSYRIDCRFFQRVYNLSTLFILRIKILLLPQLQRDLRRRARRRQSKGNASALVGLIGRLFFLLFLLFFFFFYFAFFCFYLFFKKTFFLLPLLTKRVRTTKAARRLGSVLKD
jgi:hypothetical protein